MSSFQLGFWNEYSSNWGEKKSHKKPRKYGEVLLSCVKNHGKEMTVKFCLFRIFVCYIFWGGVESRGKRNSVLFSSLKSMDLLRNLNQCKYNLGFSEVVLYLLTTPFFSLFFFFPPRHFILVKHWGSSFGWQVVSQLVYLVFYAEQSSHSEIVQC